MQPARVVNSWRSRSQAWSISTNPYRIHGWIFSFKEMLNCFPDNGIKCKCTQNKIVIRINKGLICTLQIWLKDRSNDPRKVQCQATMRVAEDNITSHEDEMGISKVFWQANPSENITGIVLQLVGGWATHFEYVLSHYSIGNLPIIKHLWNHHLAKYSVIYM